MRARNIAACNSLSFNLHQEIGNVYKYDMNNRILGITQYIYGMYIIIYVILLQLLYL